MHALITHLNAPAFAIDGTPTTWAELYGFITGLACVWLAAARRISNFPIGILNAGFFLVLFWDARLFADASLQMLFLVLGAHGWWTWARAGRHTGGPSMAMSDASPRLLAATAAGITATALVLWPVLASTHDSAPALDALTTAGSLGAQLLLNLRRVQTWYLWIAVDCVYVPLYLSRDLVLTALVYAVFLIICISAVTQWRRLPRAVPA